MTAVKSNKAKPDSDSKKTGNSCGFSIGCLILIITAAIVIFYLFIKPALEERGYSLEDLKEKALDLKDQAHETIDRGRDVYEDNKEKLEDIREQTDEKIEEVKDKADESIDHIEEFKDQSQEKINKTAPRLIEG